MFFANVCTVHPSPLPHHTQILGRYWYHIIFFSGFWNECQISGFEIILDVEIIALIVLWSTVWNLVDTGWGGKFDGPTQVLYHGIWSECSWIYVMDFNKKCLKKDNSSVYSEKF